MLSIPSLPYGGDKAKNEIGPMQVKKEEIGIFLQGGS